jgi:hypothetical protein
MGGSLKPEAEKRRQLEHNTALIMCGSWLASDEVAMIGPASRVESIAGKPAATG